MSNDIFYTNISNLVTFYMGERPSADKFNAVNKYFSRGMRELAGAIGDIYDDGFPYIGDSGELGPKWNVYSVDSNYKRLLDIVSLGRLIGPASNLNSRMHLSHGDTTESITENIPAGVISYKLLHPSNSGQLSIPFYTRRDEYFTNGAQYRVINEREIIFNERTTSDLQVTYTTAPDEYFGGADYENAGFNVIPDPNQNTGVQIEELQDRKYKITFPAILQQQSSLLNLKDSGIDTAHDFNNAKNYELPKWLIDSITDNNGNIIEENRIIPGNFLYLKNRRTQEVYRDAIYEYESPNSIIASNIDLCVEENGAYSPSDYCVILTGTNITNMLDDLRLKWFKHSHDGEFGESSIQFKSLVGKFVDTPTSGIYGPSGNAWNQMPMYLHRDGYSNDSNLNNGHNAMRGPLAMGLVQFDPLDPVSSSIIGEDAGSGNSHPIFFGGESCKIQRVGLDFKISQDLTADLIITSEQDINAIAERSVYVEGGSTATIQARDYIVLQDDDAHAYLRVVPGDQDGKKLYLNETIEITRFLPITITPEGVEESPSFGNSPGTNDLTEYKVERNNSTWSKDIDTTKIVFGSDFFGSPLVLEEQQARDGTFRNGEWHIPTAGEPIKVIENYTRFYRETHPGNFIEYGAPIAWGNGGITTYFADPYYNTGSIWKWWGLTSNGVRQEFRDILFQKDWISDAERTELINSGRVDQFGKLKKLGSLLSVCNHRNLNCAYDIDLYAPSVLTNQGSRIDLMHAWHGVHPKRDDPSGEFGDEGLLTLNSMIQYTNYTEIEINRFVPLKRAKVFDEDGNKEFKNTFYFRINLPEAYWWPTWEGNYDNDGRNFSRFLVAFEYGGRRVDATDEYVSNNVFGLAKNGTTAFDDIQDIKVTLNGFSLGESRNAYRNLISSGIDSQLLEMGKSLYGPNDNSYNHVWSGVLSQGLNTISAAKLPNVYPVGARYFAPGFFEGGTFGHPFIQGDGSNIGGERSELIINEYDKDRFVTNLFRANTTYKVEETIHNGHVWLKITG